MLEIIIVTSVFLALGAGIGLASAAVQKSDLDKANAENESAFDKANAEKDSVFEKTDAENVPVQAVILCSGNLDENPPVYEYRGAGDCRAAMTIGFGGRTCDDGCIGLGSCAKACPEHAITVRKGIASVDAASCTGCGVCLDVCPKQLIVLRPRDFRTGKYCIRNCPGGICGACGIAGPEEKN
ncbi:MAG: 4Fe-4S binding protein [Clostridia bacterium]|nr:4Fe-4S binding protein [Clostridia bacterium]